MRKAEIRLRFAFLPQSEEGQIWQEFAKKYDTKIGAFRALLFGANALPEGEMSERQMLAKVATEVRELRREVAELRRQLRNYEGDGK